MKRITATISICFGIACIALAVSSHVHLRNLAQSSAPVDASEHLAIRILAAGLLDNVSAETIVAATFVRQLKLRVFAIVVIGLGLILVGGLLLLLPRRSGREANDPSIAPTTRLAKG